MSAKCWRRDVIEEGEQVTQIIEADEEGNLWGLEIYHLADGEKRTSDRVSLNSRTLPLGFYEIERSGFTEIST